MEAEDDRPKVRRESLTIFERGRHMKWRSQDAPEAEDEPEDEASVLRRRLAESSRRAAESESDMRRAAEIGRDLLVQLHSAQAELDRERQGRHEAQTRLEARAAMEKELREEADHLREALQARESSAEAAERADKECQRMRAQLDAAIGREREAEERARWRKTLILFCAGL